MQETGLPENPHHNRAAPSPAYSTLRIWILKATMPEELEALKTNALMYKASASERALLETGITYYKTMLACKRE